MLGLGVGRCRSWDEESGRRAAPEEIHEGAEVKKYLAMLVMVGLLECQGMKWGLGLGGLQCGKLRGMLVGLDDLNLL